MTLSTTPVAGATYTGASSSAASVIRSGMSARTAASDQPRPAITNRRRDLSMPPTVRRARRLAPRIIARRADGPSGSGGLGPQLDPDRLRLGVLVVGAERLVVAAEARLLVAAERRRHVAFGIAVDPDRAGLEGSRHPMRDVEVVGVERG